MPIYASYISSRLKISFGIVVIALIVTALTVFAMLPKNSHQPVADIATVENGAQTITYKGDIYSLDTEGMAETFTLADGSKVPGGSKVYIKQSEDGQTYEVLYFPPGTDPATASTVSYTKVTLASGKGYVASTSTQTVTTKFGDNPYPQDPSATTQQKQVAKPSGSTTTSAAFYMNGSVYHDGRLCGPLAASSLDPLSLNMLASQPDGTGNLPGYYLCKSEGDKPLKIVKLAGIDGTTAKIYTYPDAYSGDSGIVLGSSSVPEDVTYYPPSDAISDKDYQMQQAYKDKQAALAAEIKAKEQEKADAEKKAREAKDKKDAQAAAKQQAKADAAALAIDALKKTSQIVTSALPCGNQYFLTLPAWYRGVVDGNCNIRTPKDAAELRSTIITVILNVVEIILRIVGYASAAFIIYGGYKYMISAGSPDGMVGARKTIMNAVIGLVISLASIAIVTTIANSI